MNKIAEQNNSNRKAETFEKLDGTFEIYCSINGNASRAFPSKTYKTAKAATKYGAKFLTA